MIPITLCIVKTMDFLERKSYSGTLGHEIGRLVQVLPKAPNLAHMSPMAYSFDFCRAPRRAPPSGPPF